MIFPDYTIQSDKATQRLVVLLHGYGSNGADLLEVGHFLAPSLPLTTFISPNAPNTWDMGPFGYQWFGLPETDILNPLSMRQGLDKAAPMLKTFLMDQLKHYKLTPNQLVLIGFSQGGILALEMIFHIPGLGGVISYAGAFYPPKTIPSHAQAYPKTLLVHGTLDASVPYACMEDARQKLTDLGVMVKTETCTGLGHSINVQGLHRGLSFLQTTFSSAPSVIVMSDTKKGDTPYHNPPSNSGDLA